MDVDGQTPDSFDWLTPESRKARLDLVQSLQERKEYYLHLEGSPDDKEVALYRAANCDRQLAQVTRRPKPTDPLPSAYLDTVDDLVAAAGLDGDREAHLSRAAWLALHNEYGSVLPSASSRGILHTMAPIRLKRTYGKVEIHWSQTVQDIDAVYLDLEERRSQRGYALPQGVVNNVNSRKLYTDLRRGGRSLTESLNATIEGLTAQRYLSTRQADAAPGPKSAGHGIQ